MQMHNCYALADVGAITLPQGHDRLRSRRVWRPALPCSSVARGPKESPKLPEQRSFWVSGGEKAW